MVLDTKQTIVAYRCPHCGSGVMSAVGMFSMSADMVKLKCECGKSELSIVYTSDKKVRLSVPCMICPKPHSFVVSQSIFFDKELFLLPCPYSDINICFMGDMNHVKAALAQNELELLELLEKNGATGFSALHGEEEDLITDPQIFDIVMFVIKDLEAENKIFCKCHEGEGDYDCNVNDDGINVFCKKCGASRLVPVDSMLGAQAFLDCDSLYLE